MIPNTNQHEIQEKLIQKSNLSKHRIIQNRLILLSSLNILTFVIMVFAISFYQWVWIRMSINQGHGKSTLLQFWLNLLYIKTINSPYYIGFNEAQSTLCSANDVYCLAVFYQIQFVGYLCFGICCLAAILQIYDFVRLIYFGLKKNTSSLESKDNFRHLITIFTYIIGITLSAFSIIIIDPNNYTFGVSFWLAIGTVCVFIGVIIYEQIAVRRMIRQSLILQLIQGEKQLRAEELKKRDTQTVELTSEGDYAI